MLFPETGINTIDPTPHHNRYDFAVYGLLAPEIGAAFFPQSSEKLQLINSFGVYLAAFLMR
jgi:hypothetical protein